VLGPNVLVMLNVATVILSVPLEFVKKSIVVKTQTVPEQLSVNLADAATGGKVAEITAVAVHQSVHMIRGATRKMRIFPAKKTITAKLAFALTISAHQLVAPRFKIAAKTAFVTTPFAVILNVYILAPEMIFVETLNALLNMSVKLPLTVRRPIPVSKAPAFFRAAAVKIVPEHPYVV